MVNNKWWSVVLVCAMVLGSQDTWAKRLGGGLSVGKQSGNVSQRSGNPPAQQTAAPQSPTPNATAGQSSPASAAGVPQRAWGGMLGGLAAGLGLAWLASSLGLGEGFAQFLMWALLAAAVAWVVGALMRRRNHSVPSAALAYQAAAVQPRSEPVASTGTGGYSPHNVGNDASARPWERNTGSFDAAQIQATGGGSRIGSSLSGAPGWGIPAGFDAEGFLKASKANFLSLQDAWDRSDMASLRAMMTDGMLEQIQSQLAERERSAGGAVNKTDVVMLDAHLLGIEEMDTGYMASVEFSGLIREDISAGPNPFREVWNITRSKSGTGGWLVAGVQALQ